MKDSQDWLDRPIHELSTYIMGVQMECTGLIISVEERNRLIAKARHQAKSAIRKHILQEALEILPDELDEGDGWDIHFGKRREEIDRCCPGDDIAYGWNSLRQELRNKFNDKYKED